MAVMQCNPLKMASHDMVGKKILAAAQSLKRAVLKPRPAVIGANIDHGRPDHLSYPSIAQIAAFFTEHDIAPTPDHYDLAYRHLILAEPGLGPEIAELIALGRRPITLAGADDLAALSGLLDIAEKANANIKAVEAILLAAGRDTSSFREALKGNAEAIETSVDPRSAIAELVTLTKTMIDTTRVAQEELCTQSKAMASLKTELSAAQTMADTDVVTGLANRRAFERSLRAAVDRVEAINAPLSIAFCDIDHFKLINDAHGHETGDRVIKFVGSIMSDICGKQAEVSRYGGEEFAMVFEGIAADIAFEITDAARRDVSSRKVVDSHSGKSVGTVTFSAGVCALTPGEPLSSLLRAADQALYRAKAEGRNRVIQAREAPLLASAEAHSLSCVVGASETRSQLWSTRPPTNAEGGLQ